MHGVGLHLVLLNCLCVGDGAGGSEPLAWRARVYFDASRRKYGEYICFYLLILTHVHAVCVGTSRRKYRVGGCNTS